MTAVTVSVSGSVYPMGMRPRPYVLLALLAGVLLASPVASQRRLRIGPIVSSISIENGAGVARGHTGYGGTLALLTGDYDEIGVAVARYGDLSLNACPGDLTIFALNSNYYPLGARGFAPFASTELGLARVHASQLALLGGCAITATTSELALAFGLGARVGLGNAAVASLEGRFVEIPNSFVQGLELRGSVSAAFGSVRQTELLSGTLGPAASVWIPISGTLRARAPVGGVRFHRDTKKAGVASLELDYAPLEVTGSCSDPGCRPFAVLFAPGYEPSLRPAWGRFYGVIGPLIAGFPSQGPDRGVAQGAHGGIGADVFAGRVMWNLNARVLWLQRNSGESVFAVQMGASLSPKLAHPPKSDTAR